jgi:hypothetical protein
MYDAFDSFIRVGTAGVPRAHLEPPRQVGPLASGITVKVPVPAHPQQTGRAIGDAC